MNKLGIYGGGGGGSRNGSGNGNGNGGVGYKKEEDNFGMEKNKYKNLSRCNSQ